jgi:hypothetical protein
VCDKEVKVTLTRVGTVQGICCRGDMKIVHSAANFGVWTYVDWGFLCLFDRVVHGLVVCKPSFYCRVCYCLFYFLVLFYCSNFV